MIRTGLNFAASLVVAVLAGTLGPARAQPIDVRILAINDFHGYLQPPPGGLTLRDPAGSDKTSTVAAGGAEHMATLLKQLRDGRPHSIFVAAGDLIGASPFLSSMFHDEPTIESLSLMGLALSAVGNHEFDEGRTELMRMQNGGCHPVDGCNGPQPFAGAAFKYLAASTIDTATGKTILPPYEIREFSGVPVAFIGLTLKATPKMVSPSGVAGLEFRDEADTVNRLVPELKARGVEAIVVLIHEGGFPAGGRNECPAISGPIVEIVQKLDRAVDLVISGHTHQSYVCRIDGRLVTSGEKYGTLVTAIDVQLDPNSRDIVSATADNIIVSTTDYAKDPAQTQLIESYSRIAGPRAARRAGTITAALMREPNEAGESVLGSVIADAQLTASSDAAQGGAVIAFTNPGGIRNSIVMQNDGAVSYGEVFASQPFRNQLVTVTLTGAQIKRTLEQQWADPARPRILQVSRGFSYAWTGSAPQGQRIAADSLRLGEQPIDPEKSYRVTINSFLAEGGDGFTGFKDGTDPHVGSYDVDALDAYFRANNPLSPPALQRIRRID
jgi:5'-nucleotidase